MAGNPHDGLVFGAGFGQLCTESVPQIMERRRHFSFSMDAVPARDRAETSPALDREQSGQSASPAFVVARSEREPQPVIEWSRVDSHWAGPRLLRPTPNHPFASSPRPSRGFFLEIFNPHEETVQE